VARLILYTKVDCPLCDEARDILQRVARAQPVVVEEVDIERDPELVERYGMRIPVVASPATGSETGWPFGAEDVLLILDAGYGSGAGKT
jgi:glutaredoxin